MAIIMTRHPARSILFVVCVLLLYVGAHSLYLHPDDPRLLRNSKGANEPIDKHRVGDLPRKKVLQTTDHATFELMPKLWWDMFMEGDRIFERIQRICRENNLTKATKWTKKKTTMTTTVARKHFLYSAEKRAMCCWIRKAGSTSLTRLFSELNHRSVTGDNYYRELQHITPSSDSHLIYLLKNSKIMRFLVVRHPFERLVSAYRDRIEDNSRYTAQAWIYVPKIFHLTRPEIFESPGTVDLSLSKMFYDDKRLKLVPTFGEFVDWLLQQDPSKDDDHWSQYHRHCSLCSLGYDYYVKLEDITNDTMKYVFHRWDINGGDINLARLESTRSGPTDFQRTCDYFRNLTQSAVVSLYERYRLDFEMFNYDVDRYFDCTEGDSCSNNNNND